MTEYAWDVRDRLTGVSVKNAGGTVTKSAGYKYDVYDQRISKTVDPDGAGALPSVTERYVYGTNQNIALEFDGNGNLTHRYLFADGIDAIEADEQVATGTVLWGLADHLGSVRDVIDNFGTVRNHISYDSFGNITAQSDASVVFRYGYTGREFDKESGLQYNRSRPLDPFTGRFIQEDKIGFDGGDLNLNRYVGNDPLNWSDPSGLKRLSDEECQRLLDKISRKAAELTERATRYDIFRDVLGGETYFKRGELRVTKVGGHRSAIGDLIRGINSDLARYLWGCFDDPGNPPLPPIPGCIDETANSPLKPKPDDDFVQAIQRITGLTGTALAIYIIVSEGSRLFPPRNLLPIP